MAGNNTWNNETPETLDAYIKAVTKALGGINEQRTKLLTGDFEPLCVGAYGWQAKVLEGIEAIRVAIGAAITKAEGRKNLGQPYSGICDRKLGLQLDKAIASKPSKRKAGRKKGA